MAGRRRFHLAQPDEIDKILQSKDADNTQKATKSSVKCFRDFLLELDKSADFETFDTAQLNESLKLFYVGARKSDQSYFKKSALQNLRYGLNRHTKEKMKMDIIKDVEFQTSDQVFKAVTTDLKRKGFGKVDHHPPISDQDLKSLYSGETPVFNTDTPMGLQQKCWFELMLYMCRRGRENLRSMTKTTFRIASDDTGRRFVYQHMDELDKNHRENSDASVTEGRIYELQGNKNCPVVSFEKYLGKLHPDRNDLWMRPKDTFCFDEDVWYYNSPLGKNSLSIMMLNISKMGRLSQKYTNHSVRATSITILDTSGISGRHIIQISGHKTETSLKSYSHHVSDAKKRQISDTITNVLGTVSNPTKCNQSGSSVVADSDTISEDILSDLSNIFEKDDFEFEESQKVQNSLQINTNKQIAGPTRGVFHFTPTFSENCNVTITINNNS